MRKAQARRRGYPIHAYIGANGGGKSLAMVNDTIPSLRLGRPVLSTVRLLDPATGEPHPLWTPLDDYRTLLDAEHCDVLLDEVTGVASSRESMGMPPAVANFLVQLRRRDILLRWTAPAWKRADTIIRECSQAVTLCQGFMAETVRSGERLWRPRRLFLWRTYDAATFDEWSTYRRERARPVAREIHYRPRGEAQRWYDTLDQVLALGSVSEAGLCLDCGGKRMHQKCSCGPSAREIVAEAEAVLGRPATRRRRSLAATEGSETMTDEARAREGATATGTTVNRSP